MNLLNSVKLLIFQYKNFVNVFIEVPPHSKSPYKMSKEKRVWLVSRADFSASIFHFGDVD